MLTWFITGNRFDVDYRTGELLDNTRHSCKYCNIRRSDALLDTVLSQWDGPVEHSANRQATALQPFPSIGWPDELIRWSCDLYRWRLSNRWTRRESCLYLSAATTQFSVHSFPMFQCWWRPATHQETQHPLLWLNGEGRARFRYVVRTLSTPPPYSLGGLLQVVILGRTAHLAWQHLTRSDQTNWTWIEKVWWWTKVKWRYTTSFTWDKYIGKSVISQQPRP